MAHTDKFGVTLLDKDDKIVLKSGMDVYCYLPNMYFNEKKPFTQMEDWFPITIGNTYNNVINKMEIAEDISKALYGQISPSHPKINEFINSLCSNNNLNFFAKALTTSHLVGEYTVVSTIYSMQNEDWYYQVYCIKQNDPSIKIMFYQTLTTSPSNKFATYTEVKIHKP